MHMEVDSSPFECKIRSNEFTVTAHFYLFMVFSCCCEAFRRYDFSNNGFQHC